ncbi:hypothetical protein [Demequina mangrovi]|uniref:Uncharacterized protein n=1 Tax=Demequina mangrovi TaxID=1043493 RepID=A0A1H6UZ39_9MICO|nr:hypothetical protein [Demequina mangrovi]SEI96866.1 hypothetical protein SAMN05421637_0586 [Demequina mangrovi]
MKKLLALPLVAAALIVGASPAMAGPPEDAAGTWEYQVIPGSVVPRTAGNNTFIAAAEDGQFTGTFEGWSYDTFSLICHRKAPDVVDINVKGDIYFTGDVMDQSGTLTMRFVGKMTSTNCGPADGATWTGTWTIIDGGGELADVHGHGTWTGPAYHLTYAGQVHVS